MQNKVYFLAGLAMYAERIQNAFDDLLEQRLQQEIDRNFQDGETLFNDILNEWKALETAMVTIQLSGFSLKPFSHYQEYYENKSQKDLQELQEQLECEEMKLEEFLEIKLYHQAKNQRIMELSDPKAIQKYNQLVDSFNIKILGDNITEKDIEDFSKQAREIVYPVEKSNQEESLKIIRAVRRKRRQKIKKIRSKPISEPKHQSPVDLEILVAKEPRQVHSSQTI